MIGKKIAHYQITSKLGEGSMGEVYRATDTRLNREVALKVLPESFINDPNRMARFEREAQVLASLSHPNVAGIYGLEEADGIRCLVLELIEGDTLYDRLKEGSLSLKETLDIAVQVAGALEATHEKGIIHRDLNPANVKVLPDGRVKVLDFGLAKVFMDETEAPAALSTKAGVLLGTPAYMSPEQIRGLQVDTRADIWAFGCLIFEMLTGERTFLKATVPDTLTAVLDRDPEYYRLRADTPPALKRLILRCLHKDPQRRLRHIGDALLEIDDAEREGAAIGQDASQNTPAGWKALASVGLMGLVLGALVGIVFWNTSSIAPDGPGVELVQITDEPDMEMWPSFSPDGRSFVYASNADGDWDIYLKRIGGQNPMNLTAGSEGIDNQPLFSPDGERIVFHSNRDGVDGIFVMGATGESVRRLVDNSFNPAWSPDSSAIVYGNTESITFTPRGRLGTDGQLWILDLANEDQRLLVTGRDAVQASWSPKGYRIAFWGLDPGSGQRDIWTISAEGGEPVAATEDIYTDWNPVWSADGDYLYFASDRGGGMNVWRVPLDEQTGALLGAPEQMTTGGSSEQMHVALGSDGSQMAYADFRLSQNIYRIEIDPEAGTLEEEPVAITRGFRLVQGVDVSPDGQWLAYTTRSAQEHIFVSRVDGTDLRQLTDDEFKNRSPRWSPDGKQIAFYTDRTGNYEIWQMNPEGGGASQLTNTPESETAPVWSPDGKMLAFSIDQRAFLWNVPQGAADETHASFVNWTPNSWSPDGTKLAGGTRESFDVYSLDTNEAVFQTDATAVSSRWLDDHRVMFTSGNQILLLDVESRETRELYSGLSGVTISLGGFSPDKRTLYFAMSSQPESDIWLMTLPQ